MFLATVVVVLAAVVTAVTTGVILVVGRHHHDDPDAAILVAARLGATSFFSLDYRHADADVDRVLAVATGTFKSQYAAQRKQIVDGVTAKKLVVVATIPLDGVALEYRDPAHAQVLVSVDVNTTGATGGTGAGTTSRYRARVLLTEVGTRWLVSGLNQVG